MFALEIEYRLNFFKQFFWFVSARYRLVFWTHSTFLPSNCGLVRGIYNPTAIIQISCGSDLKLFDLLAVDICNCSRFLNRKSTLFETFCIRSSKFIGILAVNVRNSSRFLQSNSRSLDDFPKWNLKLLEILNQDWGTTNTFELFWADPCLLSLVEAWWHVAVLLPNLILQVGLVLREFNRLSGPFRDTGQFCIIVLGPGYCGLA